MKEYDLVSHLERQRNFSVNTFGPGARTKGVTDHIEKELEEIRKKPDDLVEWVDVILLALDGAWRTGASSEDIAKAIEAKLTKNENREWPDWRTGLGGLPVNDVKSIMNKYLSEYEGLTEIWEL